MARIWTPFLCEHGLVRTSKMKKGWASRIVSAVSVGLGYELGVGYYDWTGNSIAFCGYAANEAERKCVNLEPSRYIAHRGLYPPALASKLRAIGIERLNDILARGQAEDPFAPNYLALDQSFREELECATKNTRYVPPYQYLNEADLRTWCRIVLPFIPECIETLDSFLRRSE